RRCGAYNVSIPCSRCSRHELKWYNNGDYWARYPSRPCIALPMIFLRPSESALAYNDRKDYDGRNQRLHNEGITDA
ncbi:unnamed protein product, partial [Symbiodinium pilosum]